MAATERRAHRLSPDDQADLVWFWNDAEAESGIHSNMGAIIELLRGSAPTDEAREELMAHQRANRDVRNRPSGGFVYCRGARHIEPHELMFERSDHARRRGRRVRRALVALVEGQVDGSRHATVLHLVYGPTHRRYPYDRFRELAPLVELTSIWAARAERDGITLTGKAGNQLLRNAPFAARVLVDASHLLASASHAYERATGRRADEEHATAVSSTRGHG